MWPHMYVCVHVHVCVHMYEGSDEAIASGAQIFGGKIEVPGT